MSTQIAITGSNESSPSSPSHEAQLKAAQLLSNNLRNLGIDHAYIGGFAWALLGSDRPTEMNVLVKVENIADLHVLRNRLSELDPRFVCAGIKLYIYQDPIDPSRDTIDQLRLIKDKVLVETLPAGSLGLPQVPKPVLDILSVPILHPSILILTKLKRWAMNLESTRPKTLRKQVSDTADINYMLLWLAENNFKVEFNQYSGKTKDEFIPLLQKFRNKFADNEDVMAGLKAALTEGDWDLL